MIGSFQMLQDAHRTPGFAKGNVLLDVRRANIGRFLSVTKWNKLVSVEASPSALHLSLR
jgi:hypothetical protein